MFIKEGRKEGRIGWIDALRGFTILLVVFGHINNISLGFYGYESKLANFFISFRMPMFFFISGFVAYKAFEKFNRKFFFPQLKKKCRVQLVPFFVFFCIYNLLFSGGIPHFWVSGFGGYWFTLVLFEMLLIYYSVQCASKVLNKDLMPLLILFSILGIIGKAFFSTDFPGYGPLHLGNLFKYFQFFTLGLYYRKYLSVFERIISNDIFKISVFFIFILSYVLLYSTSFFHSGIIESIFQDIVIRYAGLFSILVIFSSSCEYFNSDNIIPRQMRYIGRRTLDVYLIHYFMLPNLTLLKPYFQNDTNMFLQMTLSLVISILIVMFCIIVSNCLRSSKLLAHWLFGLDRAK